jgi:integrase
MAIRRRGSGWQVRVRPFADVTLPTREAAETVELDLKLRKKLGQLYQEKPTMFGAELDAQLARKKAMGGRRGRLRPATVAFYEQCVAPWEPLRDVLLPNLRRALVEDHVAARAAVAPVAARNELQFAKAALRAASARGQQVDPGIFTIDPVRHETGEGRALEFDELNAIASWMPERIKRIVPLCGVLGLRWTEAVNLDERMLDLDNAHLTIPRALNKSRREKPIPLAAYEVQLLREQLLARPRSTKLVFPNAKGGVYTKSGFRSVWLPALLSAGFAHETTFPSGKKAIVAEVKFHWLRHTAISLSARAGMKAELIAERVGHSDGGALIYRRYRHLYPSEVRAAVSLVDELVAASQL